ESAVPEATSGIAIPPTATPIPILIASPTLLVTPTATSIPSATPIPIPLSSDIAALGLPAIEDAPLDDLIVYALSEGVMPLPLRLSETTKSYSIQVDLQNAGDTVDYGIAFRMKDEFDYLLLLIDVGSREWRVEERRISESIDADGITISE